MDLLDDPQEAGNTPEFTVSELSGAIKRSIEAEFGHVRVKGEVGRVVLARSGHLYFDLKDDRNVLSCMTWKGQLSGLDVRPEEGMEVVVSGRMTASGFKSQYSLNALQVQVAGVGALMAMLEARKKALQAEGLFDAARKQALPFLPEVIGVVTSPQGAVIRDILHRLRDRFPRKVLVWPVAVQGKACAPDVANAIAGFNEFTQGGALPRPDLLIVARGGGSIEDLWGFNEEIVARAAAASSIPLISAVGHETDTTLIDYVADRRAPTPSAAAEMAVPVRLELLATIDQLGARARRAVRDGVVTRKQRLKDISRALPRPEQLAEPARQRLDYWTERLDGALRTRLQSDRMRLGQAAAVLRPAVLTTRLTQENTQVRMYGDRLGLSLHRMLALHRRQVDQSGGRLKIDAVQQRVAKGEQEVRLLSNRLFLNAEHQLSRLRVKLQTLDRLHETLGYRQTLQRGYAVVRSNEKLITRVGEAVPDQAFEVEFYDGKVAIGAVSGRGETAPKTTGRAKPTPPKSDPDQGQLF